MHTERFIQDRDLFVTPPPPKKKPQGFQAVRLAAMFTAKDANTYKLLCPDIANRDSLKQELWN